VRQYFFCCRPPASLLKLKKRKRKNSSDMSDAELSPRADTPDSNLEALVGVRLSLLSASMRPQLPVISICSPSFPCLMLSVELIRLIV